jgi:hypothetical protein
MAQGQGAEPSLQFSWKLPRVRPIQARSEFGLDPLAPREILDTGASAPKRFSALARAPEIPYTDPYMELTKKTTILFSPRLHDRLARLAKKNKTSIGELVRHACEQRYFLPGREERIAAARKLASFHLPVGTPGQMKRESVPDPKDLD